MPTQTWTSDSSFAFTFDAEDKLGFDPGTDVIVATGRVPVSDCEDGDDDHEDDDVIHLDMD